MDDRRFFLSQNLFCPFVEGLRIADVEKEIGFFDSATLSWYYLPTKIAYEGKGA